jgi:ATP-dependent helicase HrpA
MLPAITYPEDLPVSRHRQEILQALRDNQVVVIAGATGSGKTTQLPKLCLELGRKNIAHTQPRRIAARSVAERIAEELGSELGELVGYQVRFTDKASRSTRVKVMTDGILLNAIQNDPELKTYDTVIIDEAHERSLNIDFLLGYLKQLVQKRSDLKVIITSATIDPESFAKHFGGAPVIEVSGRSYPIEIRYRPTRGVGDAETDVDPGTLSDDYLDGLFAALQELEQQEPGDVLVFLSGESEIKDAQEFIQGKLASKLLGDRTELLPLYGRLSASEQHRVFEPSKVAGLRRRIILATNVAETSLTIPNIRYVIDAGTARISRYSARAKVQRLPIEAISQASANQRAGRAGRLAPGVVIRLYSQEDFEARSEFTDPEILRTSLAAVILQAAALGISDISKFPFLQPPDSRGVKDGVALLRELGAVADGDQGIALTPLGKKLARLPIEPRFARMLLEAGKRNLVREVMAIVAGLTIQDPRERPLESREKADQLHARFTDPTSDFLTLLNLYNYVEDKQRELSSSAFRRMCRSEYLNYLRVREWQDLMRQLVSVGKPLGLIPDERRKDPDGIHRCILSGLLSQLGVKGTQQLSWQNGKSKPKGPVEYLGSGGKKFVIFPGSALAKKAPDAIMSAELVETSRLFARMNAEIQLHWAEELAGEHARRSYSEPHWEKKQGAVIGYESVTLFGLTLISRRKMQYSRVDPMLCRELFIKHALVEGEWDSKQQFERENNKFLGELEQLAERTRSPELVPGESQLFEFFNNRVPLDVFSTRDFEGWWRKAKVEKPDLLNLSREKLALEAKEQDLGDLPTSWSYGDQQLDLSYKFEPGAVDDGVTVEIPIAMLASLTKDPFEWLVPGMRLELLTELIRSLPKSIRKNVVPAKDWAQRALQRLPEIPTGTLLEHFSKALSELSGLKITPSDFDFSGLPTSLRMTFRIMEGKKVLGVSDDLAALKVKFADRARGELARVLQQGEKLERKLASWDFDSLPEQLEVTLQGNQVVGYPGLRPADPAEIKVFATAQERAQQHLFGVANLLVAAIPSAAKYVKDHLSPAERLALSALGYADAGEFLRDLTAALAQDEILKLEPSGLILTKAQFEKVLGIVSPQVLERAFDLAPLMARISEAAALAESSAGKLSDPNTRGHVSQLLAQPLIQNTTLARLNRLPVYLRAVDQRATKGSSAKAELELETALSLFAAAGGKVPVSRTASAKLQQARWLLEELRVSLFAQSLGTAEPVSVQRISKLLA